MAVTTQGKGRGLMFAEQQLLRHGWEQGKGLGKDENGISEAIKVKVKCDKGGVGHKEGEQFTFHWWDHVFNKASSGLAVESDQDGVVVKKIEEEKEEEMISNKKPRKAKLNKSALYGCFVKSATLLSGQEHPEQRSSSSEDSSSSDDEEKLDLSSTTKLSDEALMKACGGRTAHKGARHGLKMSAKLARLEQQEQEFMAKYGKKNLKAQRPESEGTSCSSETILDQDVVIKTKHKKPKKKEHCSEDLTTNCAQEDNTSREASQIHHNDEIAKKQREKTLNTLGALLDSNEGMSTEIKKKKKRKHLEKVMAPEDGVNRLQECSESFQQHEKSVSKKAKSKKKKDCEKSTALKEGQNQNSVVATEDSTYIKVPCGQEQQEEGSFVLQPASDSVPKKKKKKSSKSIRKESFTTHLDSPNILEPSTVEVSIKAEDSETTAGERKKSKSKKRKRCRKEDQEGVVENGLLDEQCREKDQENVVELELDALSKQKKKKTKKLK